MKKRITAGLLILILPLLFGCDRHRSTEDKPVAEPEPKAYDHVVVDVAGDESGYYSFMAERATLDYYGDELINVFIEEPTLLAFKVADTYPEGIGVIDGKILRELTEEIDGFLAADNRDSEAKALLEHIGQELKSVALLTSAST